MLNEAWLSLYAARSGKRRPPRPRLNRFVALLPTRWRFYKSGLYISPIAPLLPGLVTGMLTVIPGVGRGLILVPALIYLPRMAATDVAGTSLFQSLLVNAAPTIIHAIETRQQPREQ